jgi:hypothetical protein
VRRATRAGQPSSVSVGYNPARRPSAHAELRVNRRVSSPLGRGREH